ncbi:MAG: DUF1080 domain-containing protein [Verrucomicrobiota bacterium]
MKPRFLFRRLPLLLLPLLIPSYAPAEDEAWKEEWISLFNGRDLSGWTPKFSGYPCGENPLETFRVEDGILQVSYEDYDLFDGRFGHLYSNIAYSHYLFRMEYRFVGEMMADAPHYVNLNSGFMIHSQSPQSMGLDQDFPVSLEFQFLADEGKGLRPTGNLCTPGTNVEMDGELITQHIVKSSGPTFAKDDWIGVEIEVRGNEEVIHRVNGEEVLRYQGPQLDPEGRVESAEELINAGAPRRLSFGYIALQAEGQPVWFRGMKLKPLNPR